MTRPEILLLILFTQRQLKEASLNTSFLNASRTFALAVLALGRKSGTY